MKSLTTLKIRLGIALCAVGGIAHAQFPASPDEAGEARELRRYTVEMIIFEYAEDVGLGTEVFVPEVIEPQIEVIDALPDEPVDDEPGIAGTDREPLDLDLGIQTLPRSELTMSETLARLERLDAYRPLMHFGWTQATVAEELSPELPLARFGRPPPGLDGELQLYLNRFLHLVVDVSKLAPEGGATVRRTNPSIDAPIDRYGNASESNTLSRDVITDEYEPLRYRIREDRILKNGETRYYDHPKIGVIAKVTRVEKDGESVSAGF